MLMLHQTKRARWVRYIAPSRRALWTVLGVGLAMAASTAVAAAAPLGQDVNVTVDQQRIWPVLLPILTASIAVERAIELIWNYIDWGFMNFRGMTPAAIKSPQYVQFKSGTSLLLGVVLGILVANFMSMRVFAYFEPLVPSFLTNVPSTWDVIVTGVIIGAGSKPAHDVLGLLTKLKDFLDKSAIRQREMAGAAFADGVLKLSESETQSMVEVPGVGPTPMSAPMAGGSVGDGTEGASSVSAQERYAEELRNRTAM